MSVLSENDWNYSENAIGKIINSWSQNKQQLMNIFRNYPNWDEEKKMIVFTADYEREIEGHVCHMFWRWLREQMTHEQSIDRRLREAIDYIYSFHSTFIDELVARRINEYAEEFGLKLKVSEGQKTTRVTNKLLTTLGFNTRPDYNKEFAKYSDALSPLKIQRFTCLSLNPVDFLLMSNGNSWESCHNIVDPGCYCSGTVSYMLDETSFVYYTVDADYSGDRIERQPKITRQMFAYNNEKLLQSRLYPQGNDYNAENLYAEIRSLVQKIVADCLGVPNFWVKQTYSNSRSLAEKEYYSTHYHDVNYFENCSVSILKGSENVDSIVIGSAPMCVDCGAAHSNEESLHCYDCSGSRRRCYECGSLVHEDDTFYVDDELYCRDCVSWCEHCEDYVINDHINHIRINGDIISVCDHCLGNYYTSCDCCGEWASSDDVTYVGGDGYVCDHCLDEHYTSCDICGDYERRDEMTELKDGTEVCRSCLRRKCVECDECGAWIEKEDAFIEGDDYLCESCHEEKNEEDEECEYGEKEEII